MKLFEIKMVDGKEMINIREGEEYLIPLNLSKMSDKELYRHFKNKEDREYIKQLLSNKEYREFLKKLNGSDNI